MTHSPLLALMVAAVSIATPTVAAAKQPVTVVTGPQDGLRSARVAYGDLDLATVAGRLALQRRVSAAAAKVCKDNQPAVADMAFAACRSNAVRDAEPQVAAAIDTAQRFAGKAAPMEIVVR